MAGAVLILWLVTFASLLNHSVCDEANADQGTKDSLIRVRRCNNGGCPYAASWLVSIDLLMNIDWIVNSTKMEDASIRVLQNGFVTTYQIGRPDIFYVNHLSQYEHNLRRKTHNVSFSVERCSALAAAAFNGECSRENSRVMQKENFYLGLVPFYGGLPLNTTSNFKVKSVGEGNSVVSRSAKALQAVATVCSLMRYFGRVVVGVASVEDEAAIKGHLFQLGRTNPAYLTNVQVIRFDLARGSNLPFYLLAWAQLLLLKGNCLRKCQMFKTQRSEYITYLPPVSCAYCDPAGERAVYWEYLRTTVLPRVVSGPGPAFIKQDIGIRYIYYTECDQILRFDDIATLNAVTSANNLTSVVLGRRRYKQGKKYPEDYDKILARGPGCGREGFYISAAEGIKEDQSLTFTAALPDLSS